MLSILDHPNLSHIFIFKWKKSGKNLREDYNKITFNDIKFVLYQVFSFFSYINSKSKEEIN